MSEKEQVLETGALEAETQENMDDADARVYEIGAHIIPTLGEEGAKEAFDALRDRVMKAGGAIIAEEAPTLLTLAYKMRKDIDRKRYTYTTAYFGWVKFEAAPEAAHALKATLEDDRNVLRAILIKTTRETFVRQMSASLQKAEPAPAPETTKEVEKQPKEEGEPMTVEAMDAEIDKLVV